MMYYLLAFVPPILTCIKYHRTISEFFVNFKNNIPVYKEIYRNTTWKTMVEFSYFKSRIAATNYFENGLLEKYPKSYELTYYDGTLKYVIKFPKRRGPCPFSQVTTEKLGGEDVLDITTDIRKVAGPSHNFHGIATTPDLLGYEFLTFHLRTGRILRFDKDEIIDFEKDKPVR